MGNVKFNEKQLEAINHYKGACAVIAGAGSGKSTVMTERVVTLIEKYNVNPKDIVVLSFSEAAACNMVDKLRKKDINGVTSKTFHSLCKMILEDEGREINLLSIDDNKKEENREYKKQLIMRFRNYNKNLKNGEIESIIKFILYQGKYGVRANEKFVEFNVDVSQNEARKYFEIYEDFKKSNNLMDFDDLLIAVVELFENGLGINKHTYKFLMVDEHQDSNLIQNKLIKLLCPSENVFCVFDYRQSIYGFSGANPEYCMNFDKDFNNAKVINLDMNYRSCNNIVNNANNFISKYYGDYKHYKDAIASNKKDGYVKLLTSYDKLEEANKIVNEVKNLLNKGVKAKDIGILFRTNATGDLISKKFNDENINIDIKKDGNFFSIKEIDIVINIIKLVINTNNDEAMKKLLDYRVEGLTFISKYTREELNKTQGRYNLNLFQSLSNTYIKSKWVREDVNNFTKNIEKLKVLLDRKITVKDFIKNIYILFKLEDYIEKNYESSRWDERKDYLEGFLKFAKGSDLNKFLKFTQEGGRNNKKNNSNAVQLRTVHGSKGLEWDYVFVVSIEDGKFPHRRSDEIEEARLFYVAITRAKKSLYLSQIYEGNQFVEEYFN